MIERRNNMNFSRIYSQLDAGTLVELPTFKDVDATSYPIVKQILDAYSNGNITEANRIRKENDELLESIEINASTIFKIIEELYNLELLAMSAHTSVYVGNSNKPTPMTTGDIWFAPMSIKNFS